MAALVALSLLGTACESEAQRAKKAEEAVYREKYAKAEALFKERCKTAGVVTHRTVRDVEGIELKKIRRDTPWGGKEYFDPMWEDAALAGTSQGDEFIKDFLLSEVRLASHPENRFPLRRPERKTQPGELPMRPGYRFVEHVDPADGLRYRYRLPFMSGSFENSREGAVARERSTTAPLRYAFTYEGLVDPADRALWVAGVRLRAIDQQSGEILGEMTRYVFDPGFGVSTTGRWPWEYANGRAELRCPANPGEYYLSHRHFIDSIVVPTKGD